MNPRHSLTRIRTLYVFSCLFAQIALFSAYSEAAEPTKTVRLDGKTVYVPDVKLTQGINPVEKFLYVGSWDISAGAKKNKSPLCDIDAKNGVILIESSDCLLKNSTPAVLTKDSADAFLDGIPWGRRQATHIAFNITSDRRQPAVIEISGDSDASLFQNGKFVGAVRAGDAQDAGGRGYFPLMLKLGKNNINIRQFSIRGRPQIQMAVYLDHSQDLTAAWQSQHGLLQKLVYSTAGDDEPVRLDWNPNLSFAVSLDVRDVSTNKIIFQKGRARRGGVTDDEGAVLNLAPGIYEAIYQVGNDTASEFFMVGSPADLFAKLQASLSQSTPDSESKLDIDAQLRRARILLAEKNHNALDRRWQEKVAYTFSCLATFDRRLNEGATNIAKDQPGLHIRGFASAEDGSDQFYRLYIPSTYKSDAPLPLLVIPSTRISKRERAFIEGPVIADQRKALLWAKSAEGHGFAVLWPGYRGAPDGYSYESVNIDEAIRAVEKDYAIDPHRISVYATCNAGYNAGRLVEEYNNRFAAIVYDRAVFDLSLGSIQSSPSLMAWYTTVNPARHVIGNPNIKIFVMHDGTRPAGHGPMEFSTQFLDEAKKTRGDVVSSLGKQPVSEASRMDMVFSWLAECRNNNPDNKRSHFLTKTGYTGPIMEIFATPLLVVEGTRAQDVDLENIHNVVESIKKDYSNYFHGAQCAIKKDADVTEDDIATYSLILVGNPQSNSVWEKLQPKLSVKVTSSSVMYGDVRLTGLQPFQAIVRHPAADAKYVLMIGAKDLKTLKQITTDELFTAWYDCCLFAPDKHISKLDSLHDVQSKGSILLPTKGAGSSRYSSKP